MITAREYISDHFLQLAREKMKLHPQMSEPSALKEVLQDPANKGLYDFYSSPEAELPLDQWLKQLSAMLGLDQRKDDAAKQFRELVMKRRRAGDPRGALEIEADVRREFPALSALAIGGRTG